MRVLIHVRAHVLGRVRVLGLVLDRGLGLHGTAGGAILTSLPGMSHTVEGAEVGLGLGEEVEELHVEDIVQAPGLVLHVAGLLDLRADDRQVTSVEGMGDAERGRLHILCAPVAHERDPTLVHVPVLHVLARGHALCLTLPIQDTVGAGAGVARVLAL